MKSRSINLSRGIGSTPHQMSYAGVTIHPQGGKPDANFQEFCNPADARRRGAAQTWHNSLSEQAWHLHCTALVMPECTCPNPIADDGHVLIVEDERVSRKALALLLDACGYKTVAAGSAEEALDLLRSDAPDIALVDVDLPGMSGLELVERLESFRPGTFTVLITAAEGERIRNFLRDHPVGYLRKPVDFDHLLEVLNEVQTTH
jgi:CheY-like chemotaxis protein